MDEVLFPYSEDEPVLRLCKWSGSGHVWCYPDNREKYAKVCKDCSMNPDIKEGLSIYETKKRIKPLRGA